MCQKTFLGTLDIYGVENSLIRYLWMLKSSIFSVMLCVVLSQTIQQIGVKQILYYNKRVVLI
jgi:hypothetical protein